MAADAEQNRAALAASSADNIPSRGTLRFAPTLSSVSFKFFLDFSLFFKRAIFVLLHLSPQNSISNLKRPFLIGKAVSADQKRSVYVLS